MTAKAETPAPLRPAARVGIVAGTGRLPLDVATAIRNAGGDPFVIRIGEEGEHVQGLDGFAGTRLSLLDFGRIMPELKRAGVGDVVFAGGLARRPDWRDLRPRHWRAVGLVPTLLRSAVHGDDGALRVAVRAFEARRFRVLGAHQVAPELLAPAGTVTRLGPGARDRRDIEAAALAARTVGALDVGQGAISVGGRVVALEGIEGTDRMIERVAGLRAESRLPAGSAGVLVKTAKPGQELRADLPTIGLATVRRAADAGLAGIAVEAGRALILELPETVTEADRRGLFIIGIEGTARP